MSSVTRFIRQIPLATTYYNAAGVVNGNVPTNNSSSTVFEFVPSSSNYVGNYPNGFNDPTGGFVAPASAALATALNQAYNAAGGNGSGLVLRDMGKTIFAPVTANVGTPATAVSQWGYFRQVQLLRPAVISQTAPNTGFMGGLNGPTFGVLGGANTPDAYTDYLTFYIPVSIGGITGSVANTQAYALAGGQM
jgi:hypothetical protein